MNTGLGIIPYLVMLFIILICIAREGSCKTERAKKWNFIIALLPVFVLIAFKSESIGADTNNYLEAFSDFRDINYGEEGEKVLEFGFQYLLIILRRITHNPQSLLITLGILTFISLYRFIKQTASNWCLALYFFICLGFFQFVMSGIRQSMAIEIMLLAYPLIKKKKLFPYMLMVVVASLFHRSAIVCAPLYFIANMTVNRRNTTMMIVVMTILFFFSDTILLTTADVMNYVYGIERTDNGHVFLLIVLLITYFAYKNKEIILSSQSETKNLFNANYVSVLLWIIRMVSRTVERVSLYFMPYTYVLLEQSISSQPKSRRGSYILFVLVAATALFLHRMIYQIDLNNYLFFWQ